MGVKVLHKNKQRQLFNENFSIPIDLSRKAECLFKRGKRMQIYLDQLSSIIKKNNALYYM